MTAKLRDLTLNDVEILTCGDRSMLGGAKKCRKSTTRMFDFIKKNFKLIKQCAQEFSQSGKMMKSIKFFGLPKNRLVYDTVSIHAPIVRSVSLSRSEQPEIHHPLEIKICKPQYPLSDEKKDQLIEAIEPIIESITPEFIARSRRYTGVYSDSDLALTIRLENYFKVKRLYVDCMPRRTSRVPINHLITVIYKEHRTGYQDMEQIKGWIRDLTEEGIEPNPGPYNKKKPMRRNKPTKKKQKKIKKTKYQAFLDRRNANKKQSVQGQRELVYLDYEEAITDYNNAGGPIIVDELIPTNIYDIDPLILSRSIQFEQYKFDLYQYAKVLQAYIEYKINNLEQHALDAYMFFTTVPIASSIGSRSQLEALIATGILHQKVRISEQYNGGVTTLSRSCIPANIVGLPQQYMADIAYSNTSSSGPTSNIYSTLVVFSSLGTIPSGFSVSVSIKLDVLYYEARPVNTLILSPLELSLQRSAFFREYLTLLSLKIKHPQETTSLKRWLKVMSPAK